MPAKPKYDWEALEVEYVTSDVSLRDMAKTHNIPLPTIRDNSKKRHWPKKRSMYRDDIVTTATQNKRDIAVMDKAKFDEFSDRTCDVAVAKAAKDITEKYNLELETTGSEAQNKGLAPVTLKMGKVNEALEVVRRAQEIKYRRLGIPPPKHVDSDAEDIFRDYQKTYAKEMARLQVEMEVKRAASGGDVKSKDNGEEDEIELVPYDFISFTIKPPGSNNND